MSFDWLEDVFLDRLTDEILSFSGAQAGTDIHAWLGEQIKETLKYGDGLDDIVSKLLESKKIECPCCDNGKIEVTAYERITAASPEPPTKIKPCPLCAGGDIE